MKRLKYLTLTLIFICSAYVPSTMAADPCPDPTAAETIPPNTRDSLSKIQAAISIYYGDTEGLYPKDLNQLVPKYLPSIPPCSTKQHGQKTGVQYFSNSSVLTDSGKWGYVNSTTASDQGKVFIDCKHIDPLALVIPSTNQEKIVKAQSSLGALRSAVSIFYGDTEGLFPATLSALVPKYLTSLPYLYTCATGLQSGETIYPARPTAASIRAVRNTGKWGYVPKTGEVFIDSREDSLFLK